jgi:hypothetical protein
MRNKIIKEEITSLNIWKYYPKSDWSEGSYNDIFRKAADAKRKKYGTTAAYNGY